jgi:hypothetical protein
MNAAVKPTTETPCTCNTRHAMGSVKYNGTVEARLLLHCFSWPIVNTVISGMSRNYFFLTKTHLADSSSASLSASNTPHRRRRSIKQVWRTWCSTVFWNKGKLWDSLQPSHLGRRTQFSLSLSLKLANKLLSNSLPTPYSYPYFHLIRRIFTCAVERMSLNILRISNQSINLNFSQNNTSILLITKLNTVFHFCSKRHGNCSCLISEVVRCFVLRSSKWTLLQLIATRTCNVALTKYL